MRARLNTVVSLSLVVLPLQLSAKVLLGGTFETTTDVQNYLNLALDAAAMKETDDIALKQTIYQDGLNPGTS
jgi:hypothetical protein